MTGFRSLLGKDDLPLLRNFHKMYEIGKRNIYHVNPSEYIGKILYPFTKDPYNKTERLCIRFKFKPSNADNKTVLNGHKAKIKRKVSNLNPEKLQGNKLSNRPQYTNCIREIRKADTETNSLDKKKSIFDSVFEWIRSSMVYNKEEFSFSYETDEDKRKDGYPTNNGDSAIFTKITKLNSSTNSPRKFKNSLKMENKGVQVASEFSTTTAQKFHVNKLTNPQKFLCNRTDDINKDSYQVLNNKKTKLSLLSHLGSNFSLDALNGKKSTKDIPPRSAKDGIPSAITHSKNNEKYKCPKSVTNKNPAPQHQSPKTDINSTKSITARERNGKTTTKQKNVKSPTNYKNETKEDEIRRVRDGKLKVKNIRCEGISKQNSPVQNYQIEGSGDKKKLYNTKYRTAREKSENNLIKLMTNDKINYLENSGVHKIKTDLSQKRNERRKITVSNTSEEYTNKLNLPKQKPDTKARRYPNDDSKTPKRTRDNFEYRLIKKNNGFGDVKVNSTTSHDSLHIFINKPIDSITDTKTKKGTIFDWLQVAKEKIIA